MSLLYRNPKRIEQLRGTIMSEPLYKAKSIMPKGGNIFYFEDARAGVHVASTQAEAHSMFITRDRIQAGLAEKARKE